MFEINRNFRNEGISTRHNPEFTMLEFYEAYQDYHYLMDLTEDAAARGRAEGAGHHHAHLPGRDDRPRQAVRPPHDGRGDRQVQPAATRLRELDEARTTCAWRWRRSTIEVFADRRRRPAAAEAVRGRPRRRSSSSRRSSSRTRPTSRRSRARNDANPAVTDRFELFITGREIANGFSELNDPEDQAAALPRSRPRRRTAGDEEAMYYDADYVRALEYGLPPTAGEGIGIDRLVMLLHRQPAASAT